MEFTQYDPAKAELARLAVEKAGGASQSIVLTKDDAKGSILASLARAEALAVKAGFAMPYDMGNGQTGFILGGGTDKARQLGTSALAPRAYLAAQASASATLADMVKVSPTEKVSFDSSVNLDYQNAAFPLVPVLVTIAVVAVAAAVASYAWASVEKVRISEASTSRTAAVDRAVQLATSGQPVDPKVYDVLGKALDESDAGGSIPGFMMKAGLVIGGIWVVNETGILRKLFR